MSQPDSSLPRGAPRDPDPGVSRRDWLTRAGAVGMVAAATAVLGRPEEVQAHIQPPGDFDTRWHRQRGKVNIVFDINSMDNPAALQQVRNALNGFDFSYAMRPSKDDHSAVVAAAAIYFGATPFNLNDEMWGKYQLGQRYNIKDPQTGAWAERNIFWYRQNQDDGSLPYNDSKSLWQDFSIDALQRRGVIFLC